MRKVVPLLLALAIILGSSVAEAADEKEAEATAGALRGELNLVGFDDETPDSDYAASGNNKGTYHKDFPGKPVFVERIRGKAFLMGAEKHVISYGDAGIKEEEGTVNFWVTGVHRLFFL